MRAETLSGAFMRATSRVRHSAIVVPTQKQAVVVQHNVAVGGRGYELADGLLARCDTRCVADRDVCSDRDTARRLRTGAWARQYIGLQPAKRR